MNSPEDASVKTVTLSLPTSAVGSGTDLNQLRPKVAF